MNFRGDIYIENGKIIDLKPNDNLRIHSINNGVIEVKDFGNHTAYPSFTDNHGHLLGLGMVHAGLSLYDCKSATECIEKARKLNYLTKGNWIYGIGWNQENWDDKSFPDKSILDEAFPDTPVYLIRADAHCAWVNSKALEIASDNILKSQLPSSQFPKDKNNQLTGIMIDSAMDLIHKHIPDYSFSQYKEMILKAQSVLLCSGISSICEMETDQIMLNALYDLEQDNLLKLNIYCYLKATNNEYLSYEYQNTKHIKICGIKLFADGALGSRGAALFSPYSDEIGNYGQLLLDENSIYEMTLQAYKKGLSTAIHCIGDRANHHTVNAFHRFRKEIDWDSILRIEHCQIINDDTLQQFADSNIIASIQPIHCISDAPKMVESRIGLERCRNAYRWKSLIDKGILIVSGSDFPIESHDPVKGIHALTNRIPFSETTAWNAHEIFDLDMALKSYTKNSCKALDDNNFGELKIGAIADINIMTEEISGKQESIDEILIASYKEGICLK